MSPWGSPPCRICKSGDGVAWVWHAWEVRGTMVASTNLMCGGCTLAYLYTGVVRGVRSA